jgi:hypothetical protein
MAKKPTISTISSGYASNTQLNNNFSALRTGFDNTLSLDGSTPNAMNADLDINSNDILNANEINTSSLRINGVLVSAGDTAVTSSIMSSDVFTGNGSTTVYTLSFAPFIKDNTQIYIDGVYQNKITYSTSGNTLTFTEAPPLNSAIEVMTARILTDVGTADAGSVTYTQGASGSVQTTVQAKLQESVSVKDFGATGDGVTDDTAAIQAAIDHAVSVKGKLVFPKDNYRITSTLTVTQPITIDGEMSQIFQATADIDVFLFDEGTAGSGNYQNTFDVRNLVVRTAVGTGNGFVFRNINESTFENLFVVGCGNIAFYVQGCLLTCFKHLYTGNGLTASPGFFAAGASGNQTGFKIDGYNGLGPNGNTFDRCTATNSTVKAFDVAGTGNVFIAPDAEGISTPAVGMDIQGLSTTLIGGNFEGTGNSINVNATNCTLQGVNALSFVNIPSGVYGTTVTGGNVRYLVFQAGSFNNTAIGVRIGTGGFIVDNGTNNLKLNIYNSVTAAEVGMFQAGSFTPDLEFGGASGVSTYFNNQANWWRFGNIVHFNIFLQVNALTAATGSATINMNDIPYTPAGTANIPCSWSGNGVPVGAGYGNVVPEIDAGTKTILLSKVLDSTGIAASLDEGDFSSGDQILVSGFFPLTLNT